MDAPVNQYITAVGGDTIETAKFMKNGQVVITKGALQKAMGDARLKVCEQQSQHAEGSKPDDNGNEGDGAEKSG
ncbi:hypothetical protein ACET3Z_000843 [Daucus carota]